MSRPRISEYAVRLLTRNAENAILNANGWAPGFNDGGALVQHIRGGYWSERAAVLRRIQRITPPSQ